MALPGLSSSGLSRGAGRRSSFSMTLPTNLAKGLASKGLEHYGGKLAGTLGGKALSGMGASGAKGLFSGASGGMNPIGGMGSGALGAIGGMAGLVPGALAGDQQATGAGMGGMVGGVIGTAILPGIGTVLGGLLGSQVMGKIVGTGGAANNIPIQGLTMGQTDDPFLQSLYLDMPEVRSQGRRRLGATYKARQRILDNANKLTKKRLTDLGMTELAKEFDALIKPRTDNSPKSIEHGLFAGGQQEQIEIIKAANLAIAGSGIPQPILDESSRIAQQGAFAFNQKDYSKAQVQRSKEMRETASQPGDDYKNTMAEERNRGALSNLNLRLKGFEDRFFPQLGQQVHGAQTQAMYDKANEGLWKSGKEGDEAAQDRIIFGQRLNELQTNRKYASDRLGGSVFDLSPEQIQKVADEFNLTGNPYAHGNLIEDKYQNYLSDSKKFDIVFPDAGGDSARGIMGRPIAGGQGGLFDEAGYNQGLRDEWNKNNPQESTGTVVQQDSPQLPESSLMPQGTSFRGMPIGRTGSGTFATQRRREFA